VRTLPRRHQLLGRVWGTVGAVAMRIGFIAVATYLLSIPGLQVFGGLLLLWIATKLVRESADGNRRVRSGTTLREAI
jgi:predicted tellurium resistance membrane protein TerC